MKHNGITFPKGYLAAGTACGIKKNNQKDLAVIYSKFPAVAAGTFTTNIIKGHSLQLTIDNIKNTHVRSVIINSGNANACVGNQGLEDAKTITRFASDLLDCSSKEILINSTGVIGVPLNIKSVRKGIKTAVSKLSPDGNYDAAKAIMTTDTIVKQAEEELVLDGNIPVRIGGMAKGSGMVHPNMATMIGVITSDINISKELLDKALKNTIKDTFNRVSIDGETSVCDMVVILANAQAGNKCVKAENNDFLIFKKGLEKVCTKLCRMIARDGEGATKLIEIKVEGALTKQDANKIAAAIAKSPLVKTAMFGRDANWGRIITAAGYSGANFDPGKIDIYIGNMMVCRKGTAVAFDEDNAIKILNENDINIFIKLNQGNCSDRIWTCDFSYDYVKINGSYRT